jgi:hypothetical protein
MALEAKAEARFSPHELTELHAIAELPRVMRRVLVYQGEQELRTEDEIDVGPLEHFRTPVAEVSV